MPEFLMMSANHIEVDDAVKEWATTSVHKLTALAAAEALHDDALVTMSDDVMETVIAPAFARMGYSREDMDEGVREKLLAAAWAFKKYAHREAYEEYFEPESTTRDFLMDRTIGRRAERMMKLVAHPFFRDFARDFIEALPPHGLNRLLIYIESVGWDTAEKFFREHEDFWRTQPENHCDILTRFYYNVYNAKKLALDTLAAEPMSIDPKEEMGEHSVDITITGLRESPFLRNEYADILTQSSDPDDQDFELLESLRAAKLESPLEKGTAREIGRALLSSDQSALFALLENEVFPHEHLSENQKTFVREALAHLSAHWSESGYDEFSGARRNMERETPLPSSSDPIRIFHGALRRSRTREAKPRERIIPSFSKLLHREMAEVAIAVALQHAPDSNDKEEHKTQWNFMHEMLYIETEARALYAEVHETGMPVFRDFIQWINDEHQRLGALYPGEFYVGRDTYGTLFTAANAARWGSMDSKKRHEMTVHVNVSRDLTANLHSKGRARGRAMLRDWLIREGVTLDMFGVDGGYRGTSPAEVFRGLDPMRKWSRGFLDKRIRLVETDLRERRFNPTEAYNGIVTWMEKLPKLTDRSQMLQGNKFGKYYVIAKQRSPAERVLAWTVQHAVWREFIDHEPLAEKPKK